MPRTQSLSFAIRARAPPFSRNRFQATQPYTIRSPSLINSHRLIIHKPTCRPFTARPSLFLLSRPLSRPQLPFLHPSSIIYRATPSSFVARYLSSTRKSRWRRTLRWHLRFQLYLWPSLFLVGLVITGLHQLRVEAEYPTPREWKFWARWWLRSALFEEDYRGSVGLGRGVDGWGKVGRWYKGCLEQLEEQIKKKGGRGQEVLIMVEGEFEGSATTGEAVGDQGVMQLAWDISGMSEQWRTGYHQALMGAARAAENLDGMARRKGEAYSELIPWESVVGPRNPRPKPLPWDKKGNYLHPPTDEEVEDAYEKPEVFYMRVLTTTGFNARQRLDAAIAYADWCDFKGLRETSDAMYDWAIDIAAGALPMGANGVVDIKTGVIAQGKEKWVSENLLRACTAMGVHCARNGDVKGALPIFLSVLRARRGLDAMPVEVSREIARKKKAETKHEDRSLFWTYLAAFKDFVIERPYPDIPSDGNERPYHSLKEACEEVGLMTFIGEILFATSDKEREKGLSWTRDSVGAAEAVLWVMDERNETGEEGKEKCRECLETGLDNWKKMAQQMVKVAKSKMLETEQSNGWLGLGFGKGAAIEKARQEVTMWEEEENQIELRKLKTASLVHPLKPLTTSSWVQA